MSETTMPAVEAVAVEPTEKGAYELAFHVLPTIAEGEVSRVFDEVKALITSQGGEVGVSENPERFELAYEIEKHIEGKNRKFKSAYFGWVRFHIESGKIEHILEELEGRTDILRTLLTRLTKSEEAMPFYFHEALEKQPAMAIDVDEVLASELAPEEAEAVEEVVAVVEAEDEVKS